MSSVSKEVSAGSVSKIMEVTSRFRKSVKFPESKALVQKVNTRFKKKVWGSGSSLRM